jgi:hypothetical protein
MRAEGRSIDDELALGVRDEEAAKRLSRVPGMIGLQNFVNIRCLTPWSEWPPPEALTPSPVAKTSRQPSAASSGSAEPLTECSARAAPAHNAARNQKIGAPSSHFRGVNSGGINSRIALAGTKYLAMSLLPSGV